MKKDIENREDIERMVNLFYDKVINEPGLSDFFGKVIAIDWEHHLPLMIGFWEFILFSTPNAYMGNVMNPHFKVHEQLPISSDHFTAWLRIFNEIVNENFEGIKAEEAKNAAFNIGATMKYKLHKK